MRGAQLKQQGCPETEEALLAQPCCLMLHVATVGIAWSEPLLDVVSLVSG
jgi:hypothetical protein